MPSSGLGAYQVKIHQIVFGGLFFVAVAMAVRTMMFGGTANVKLLASASVIVAAVLALDKYYWILAPFLFVTGFSVPGLPFSDRELACLVVISVYFIRLAMHKEHAIKLDQRVLIAFPIFIWICAIWMMNPTGMAMLGSSTIGARFYLLIVLGVLTLLVLSSLRFSERDCRILFYVIVAGSLFSFLRTQVNVKLGAMSSDVDFGQRGTRYDLLGALTLYTLMLSRYSLGRIFRSGWKVSLVLLLAVLTTYSGKRRGFGTVLILPFLRVFFTGRDKLAITVSAVLGVVAIGVAVAGDGSLWELPQPATRSLSIFVPKYKTASAMGMQDVFREGVRRYGREIIRESPWVGRKGFSMDRGETSWMLFGGQTDQFEGHSYAGNWHSTWYAFACDFGLPAMVMWAFFMLFALVWTYRGFRLNGFGVYSHSVYMYYAFSLFTSAIFSYTSGHSAHSALGNWITWGFLLAIQNGGKDRTIQFQPEVVT